jgi:flagellar hook-length control protein FliK
MRSAIDPMNALIIPGPAASAANAGVLGAKSPGGKPGSGVPDFAQVISDTVAQGEAPRQAGENPPTDAMSGARGGARKREQTGGTDVGTEEKSSPSARRSEAGPGMALVAFGIPTIAEPVSVDPDASDASVDATAVNQVTADANAGSLSPGTVPSSMSLPADAPVQVNPSESAIPGQATLTNDVTQEEAAAAGQISNASQEALAGTPSTGSQKKADSKTPSLDDFTQRQLVSKAEALARFSQGKTFDVSGVGSPKGSQSSTSTLPGAASLQSIGSDPVHAKPVVASITLPWVSASAKGRESDPEEGASGDPRSEARTSNGGPDDVAGAGADAKPMQSSAPEQHRSVVPSPIADSGSAAKPASPSPVASAAPVASSQTNATSSPPKPPVTTSAGPGQTRSADPPETHFVNMPPTLDGSMRGGLRVSLQTDGLGAVELHTHVHGDAVGATIAVEKHDAQVLLGNALPQLQQALSDKNLRLEQVTIQHGLQGNGAQDSEPQSKQQSWDSRSGAGSSTGTGNRVNRAGVEGTTLSNEPEIFDARGRLSVRV